MKKITVFFYGILSIGKITVEECEMRESQIRPVKSFACVNVYRKTIFLETGQISMTTQQFLLVFVVLLRFFLSEREYYLLLYNGKQTARHEMLKQRTAQMLFRTSNAHIDF